MIKMPVKEMTSEEVNQFLATARIGRLGLSLKDRAYVVPVGYAYADGKIFFHTCCKGLKMEALAKNQNVCFEVDESLSDASMSKSVIVFGKAEILGEKEKMIPYLQKLIEKYRIHVSFDDYIAKFGLDREKELGTVRICVITPSKVTGKKVVPREEH